jgi:hypothetical protein
MSEPTDPIALKGFHWRDNVYIRRHGHDVIVSRIEYDDGQPDVKEWRIPVTEFASIVCAASVGGETSERYQQALELLNGAEALTASLRAMQEERDKLLAIVESPSKWMQWCDSRVLERAEAAEAELDALRAQRTEGRQTLKALIDKLDVIAADPQFQSMAVMSYIHGVQYTGPNWATELAAAKAFLASGEDQ